MRGRRFQGCELMAAAHVKKVVCFFFFSVVGLGFHLCCTGYRKHNTCPCGSDLWSAQSGLWAGRTGLASGVVWAGRLGRGRVAAPTAG